MRFKRYGMEEAKELMQAPGSLIVDVRGRDEYAEGHIPGAICIPLDELTPFPPEELWDLEQQIFVYCASGIRSIAAAHTLAEMGYINVCDLGSINNWKGELKEGLEP